MDLQHWQAEFENWLKNHHQHQDAAHDVCHFRRVWATAQKLAADDDVDMLVILTACYFHDIVSLAKIIRNGSVLQSWRQKRRVACSVKSSCNFRRRKLRPFVMPLPLTVSARKSPLNNGS